MTRAGLTSFLQQSAEVIEELYGETVTINHEEIQAAVSNPTEGGTLGLGVEALEAILKVRILKSRLPEKPAHGKDVLTFNGDDWRIDDVTDDRRGEAWLLTCMPAEKRS